jgi:hypothetical protein
MVLSSAATARCQQHMSAQRLHAAMELTSIPGAIAADARALYKVWIVSAGRGDGCHVDVKDRKVF